MIIDHDNCLFQKYDVVLREKRTYSANIVTVKAHDADAHAVIEYAIAGGDRPIRQIQKLITLNPNSGAIRLKTPLDREEHDGYVHNVFDWLF